MKSLFKFFGLPYREKKLFCRALITVCVVRLGLWLLPFKWVKRFLSIKSPAGRQNQKSDWVVINGIARAVKRCGSCVPYATCLTQALATHHLLDLQGESSELKVGVAKDSQGRLEAHAWLEVDGQIIIGKLPRHQRFAVLEASNLAVL